jgi:prepilin-type processing-associated H-X9-DG protein
MKRSCGRTAPAFTLLEAVIVLATFSFAVIIISATALRLQRASRTVSCEANVQQILQALFAHCADHFDLMPFGRADSPGSAPDRTWVDTINPLVGGQPGTYSTVFQCPEAAAVFPHPNSYAMNMIVAIDPQAELQVGFPPNAQTHSARLGLTLPFGTALVWNKPIQPNWSQSLGHLVGYDIDGQRFWLGAQVPQQRYYNPNDPYAQFPPGTYGNGRPIQLNVGSNAYHNIDPPANSSYPYQGNLRFRHTGNVCNVGFSDGSVRQFTATVRPDLTVSQHDAIRKYFMIDPPKGVVPNPGFPF